MKRLFRGWSWEHWYNLAREDIEEAFASVRRAARLALYAGVSLWVFSGFHTIGANEAGIETICGRRLRKLEEPGLRYRLPWPVGSVHALPVRTQQIVAIGMSEKGLSEAQRRGDITLKALETSATDDALGLDQTDESATRDLARRGGEKEGFDMSSTTGDGLALLSGDHNLIRVMAVLQYVIADPVSYYYGSEGTELLLRRAGTSALLEAVGTISVDEVLATRRAAIQDAVRLAVQTEANRHNLGVQVASVQIQKVSPPSTVQDAFSDVSTAREERQTLIEQARQYEATEINSAKAEARRMVNEATAFKSERMAAARGESSRFAGVLREYRQSGRLVGDRLRLETMEQVMSQARKVYVGGGSGSANITIVEEGPDAAKE